MVAQEVVAPAGEQAEAGVESQVDVTEPMADVTDGGEPVDAVLDAPGETEEQEGEPGAGEPGEPEPPPEPTNIAALIERHPELQAQLDERDDVQRNAGAQQRDALRQREAADNERTQSIVTRALEEARDSDDPDAYRRIASNAIQSNRSFAAVDLAAGYADVLKEHYTLTADVRDDAVAKRETGDMDGYVMTMIDGARTGYLREVSLADVPKDSKLHGEITAEVSRRMADEATAKDVEASPKPRAAPAATPGGAPVVGSGPTYTEYAAASFEQRKEWKAQGVEPVPD